MGLGVRSGLLSRLVDTSTNVVGGVALTFDDGPMPGTTNLVLDMLEKLDVVATFFCVGRNAERHPTLLRRMLSDGHAIGSHSLTHEARGSQSPRRLVQDYIAGRQAVEHVLGRSVPLFRPPYGFLTLATVRTMRSFDTWTWSVDPQDWRPDANIATISLALEQVGAGDVVLLHDWLEPRVPQSSDRSATLGSVEGLVRRLRASGVPLVRLPSCDGPGRS